MSEHVAQVMTLLSDLQRAAQISLHSDSVDEQNRLNRQLRATLGNPEAEPPPTPAALALRIRRPARPGRVLQGKASALRST